MEGKFPLTWIVIIGAVVGLLILVLFERARWGAPTAGALPAGAEKKAKPPQTKGHKLLVEALGAIGVVGLLLSGGAILLGSPENIQGRGQQLAAAETEGVEAGVYSDVLLEKMNTIGVDIQIGHPPLNHLAVVDSVIEKHRWVQERAVWKTYTDIRLMGSLPDLADARADTSKIYLEIGQHGEDGVPYPILENVVAATAMERGPGRGEWDFYGEPFQKIPGTEKGVSILEIRPVDVASTFDIMVSYTTESEYEPVRTNGFYLAPSDFGEVVLKSARGSLSCPSYICTHKLLYAAWSPVEKDFAELLAAKGLTLQPSRPWGKTPLLGLHVWKGKDPNTLLYMTSRPLNKSIAFIYECQGTS